MRKEKENSKNIKETPFKLIQEEIKKRLPVQEVKKEPQKHTDETTAKVLHPYTSTVKQKEKLCDNC